MLTLLATHPLIFRIASSTYGRFDHVSSDGFGIIGRGFWWTKFAVWNLGLFPTHNPYAAAPYGQFQGPWADLLALFALPLSILIGPLAAYNVFILFGIFASGIAAYLLGRHLTGSRQAGAVCGIVYGFNSNALILPYTQLNAAYIQWLPFYLLALIRFVEARTWRNLLLLCAAALLNGVASFPYYLIFLPLLTVLFFAVEGVAFLRSVQGERSVLEALDVRGRIEDLKKLLAGGGIVLAFLLPFYYVFVGGSAVVQSGARDIRMQAELALKPGDYLFPAHNSALFGEWAQATYWRERDLNWNSAAAYIGYPALALAVYGLYRRRDRRTAFFALLAVFAFLTTTGTTIDLLGLRLPGPALLLHMIGPFARRILIYKVFVQLAVAALAGIGAHALLSRVSNPDRCGLAVAAICAAMMVEYSIIPPLQSTDLSQSPSVYTWLADQPGDITVVEYPLKRNNGNGYQGYLFYQMIHRKPLFNGDVNQSYIPAQYRAFWKDMEVPAAISDYNNQALLRHFGVKYVIAHPRVQTRTVIFRSLPQPDLSRCAGLRLVRKSTDSAEMFGDAPTDYIYADVYEVVAEPATAMLVWDYQSPYLPHSGVYQEEKKGFYPPEVLDDGNGWRMMRNDGEIKIINLLRTEQRVDIAFAAISPAGSKTLQAVVDGRPIAQFRLDGTPQRITISDVALFPEEERVLRLHAIEGAEHLPNGLEISAAFSDFHVSGRAKP
ncbi:MAG: hypothetical protein A3F84_11690 [Candidatus Handelsmanbacteria bacterium RIFCSPLOWO2_12_FULL_64_10]|uniref:Membrane protein 6-pyruvoyl-tetrahydropterin synthase-related domain-containing protein n=1 Tax=Handelsmanbacteria sp. (strain RIFCSPLOWO2_12_FULL_64_10) TaxID=1817868 RepID=A0A1F6CBA0_HANXR|nr:MAG: hypothetical protein A3F84_11690 [Candidatus Handelsmanbacteria bacterium RIFCSPLOWO2_12_FULL_64_10]